MRLFQSFVFVATTINDAFVGTAQNHFNEVLVTEFEGQVQWTFVALSDVALFRRIFQRLENMIPCEANNAPEIFRWKPKSRLV